MKTIVNQLFIYFFLTTICGTISESVPEKSVEGSTTDTGKTKTNDCNFRNVISALNETIECTKRSAPDNNSNSKRNPLCTGIDEGVNKICQLHPNQTSNDLIQKKTTDLVNEITLLKLKNIDEFCYAMDEVTNNSVLVTDIGESPNVAIKSYRLLNSKGCFQLCGTFGENTVQNPLCPVLFWINRLLLFIETRNKPTEKQEPTGKNDAPSISDQQMQEISHNNAAGDSKLTNKNSTPKMSIAPNTEDHQGETPRESSKLPSKTPAQSKSTNDTGAQQSLKHIETPASAPQLDTAKESTPVKIKLDAKKAETQPSDNNEKGNGQGILEAPNMTGEETELTEKDKLQNPIQSNDDMDGDDIGEKSPYNIEHALDIDSPEPGETPDDNENTVLGHPEPPEPPQHFFAYFMAISLTCLLCYIGYHKKQKIMAIVFEGRKSRGGRGRRRPNTAGYRKLDCTLEEAVTSQCNSNVTHVIY